MNYKRSKYKFRWGRHFGLATRLWTRFLVSALGRFETLALASKYIIRTSGFGAKIAVKQC